MINKLGFTLKGKDKNVRLLLRTHSVFDVQEKIDIDRFLCLYVVYVIYACMFAFANDLCG